ncbi:MAG: tRNA uridine-5-carboxymethylaminomethyl(34) synthesis GTPase MnmE [bacterium]|nr:tRNA uridine-5-carboxymethylaminomethyl(34) synthesis GTPase MnmE [bacterium]
MAVHLDGDTIAALSTPLGRGGIAVIRISGEKTKKVLEQIIEKCPEPLTPRHAYHSFITNSRKRIDECVTTFFKGPHSYTGEDGAEISIHSNPFLVEEILDLITNVDPSVIRPALPGEFTYRSFKNGKMDLVQAEAVNELINANSRYYAHMTFGSLDGQLSRFMKQLKEELVNVGVRIETKIEFEEEQFLDEITFTKELEAPIKRLDTILTNARFNELLNKGLNVVIVGKVNVGKSSLFNTLLMEERSIISDIPGTTRDFIREKIYIDGFPVEITDVAGIHDDTRDTIEAIGIRRSLERLESSDAVVFMIDGSRPVDKTDEEIYQRVKDKNKLIIVNKLDTPGQPVPDAIAAYFKNETVTGISVKEHINIGSVTDFLRGLISTIKGKETDFAVNQRQRQSLEELKEVLDQVCQMVATQTGETELIAEEIRRAIEIIGRLMGEVTPDDILNQIFSQFCVGK